MNGKVDVGTIEIKVVEVEVHQSNNPYYYAGITNQLDNLPVSRTVVVKVQVDNLHLVEVNVTTSVSGNPLEAVEDDGKDVELEV